jgi:hypothetical protein
MPRELDPWERGRTGMKFFPPVLYVIDTQANSFSIDKYLTLLKRADIKKFSSAAGNTLT